HAPQNRGVVWLCAFSDHGVEAPLPAAEEEEKQAGETIGDDQAAVVAYRSPAARKMLRPASDRGVTRNEERGVTRKQSDREQRAGDQFDDACDADHCQQLDIGRLRIWKPEPFRKTVLKQQKPEHNTEDAEHLRLILIQLGLDVVHGCPSRLWPREPRMS